MNTLKQDIEFRKIPAKFSPPMLLQALGYSGSQAFIAFWWDLNNSALYCFDGITRIELGSYKAWDLFVNHPNIEFFLKPYCFGDRANHSTHWLMLDRTDESLWAITPPLCYQYLVSNKGAKILPAFTPDNINNFSKAFPNSQANSYQLLREWLNDPFNLHTEQQLWSNALSH